MRLQIVKEAKFAITQEDDVGGANERVRLPDPFDRAESLQELADPDEV